MLSMVLISSIMFTKVSAEYAVNIVGMSMDYKEYIQGVLLDSEDSDYSDLIGVELNYNYKMQTEDSNESNDYNEILLNLMALTGDTTYTGAYLGSGAGYGSVVGTTSNKIYDFNIGFARIYQQISSFDIRIALGLGYRFWRRALSAHQVEDYKWFSLRPSLVFSYKYDDFSIMPKFEYQYGLKPKMSATGLSEEFKFGSANIMEFSLPLEYAINENLSLRGSYTYQYQKIQESNVVYDNDGNGLVEPQSKAYNQYIKFGLIFKY